MLIPFPPLARCSEPPHTGPCRASLTRWFYDPMNRKCARFTYGGCNANGNNFEEEKECSAVCDGVTGDKRTHTHTHYSCVLLYDTISCLLPSGSRWEIRFVSVYVYLYTEVRCELT